MDDDGVGLRVILNPADVIQNAFFREPRQSPDVAAVLNWWRTQRAHQCTATRIHRPAARVTPNGFEHNFEQDQSSALCFGWFHDLLVVLLGGRLAGCYGAKDAHLIIGRVWRTHGAMTFRGFIVTLSK